MLLYAALKELLLYLGVLLCIIEIAAILVRVYDGCGWMQRFVCSFSSTSYVSFIIIPHLLCTTSSPCHISSPQQHQGDARFELAARHALRALWSMRTPRGLFGTSLDISTRTWKHAVGGVGPGSDSFYEYLYKSYVLFGDIEYWCV